MQKGLRELPSEEQLNKYFNSNVPKFDFHPKFKPANDVYVACNPKTGKPIDEDNPKYFTVIPMGRYYFVTIVLELGDLGLLIGEAYTYYERIKKQLEREVIKHFQEHDIFHSPDDSLAVRVVKQENGHVIYEKYKHPERGKYWSGGYTTGRNKMPIKDFAAGILKLNPQRYAKLISPELLV
jgi:hypothetical protein